MRTTFASRIRGDKPVLALTSRRRGIYIARMKWRNQLLALLCLLVFFGLGVLYFKNWVVQKPFGIILFIGEGLDPARLAIARIYAADAMTPLALDSLDYSALLKNYSRDSITPDAAAAATAIATGQRVKNGTLGVGEEKALRNLIELAHAKGRMTGLVSDSALTNPTAAAFYAHRKSKDGREQLAQDLVNHAAIDVILGGGAENFRPGGKDGTRRDGVDLVAQMQDAGYEFVQTTDELEEVPRWRRAKLFGLFGAADLAYADDDIAHADQPALADLVRRAIELLQYNRGGYLLVVDAGLMRKAAQQNDADHALLEMIELDRAIGVALEYTGTKSTVFVCGDVAVGGMTLSGFAPREASGGIWWGADVNEGPTLSWSTGPNGPAPDNAIAPAGPSPETLFEPAAVFAPQARENAADVVAFGNGPGANALHGVMESTRVFEILRDNL